MRDVTLCYLLDKENNKILLGMKKRGFGQGKLNGIGGKVEENETIEQAAVREIHEEIGVKIDLNDIKKVAELDFTFPFVEKEKDWDQTVHVFLINKWFGKPVETEEIKPEWHNIDNIPFDRMWKDDPHWLHRVINGEKLKASFVFDEDNESIKEFKVENM